MFEAGLRSSPANERVRSFADSVSDAPRRDLSRIVIPRTATRGIAKAYNAMPDFDARAVPAFKAMGREVGKQFEHVTKGLGINVEEHMDDPYPDFKSMKEDVVHNKRLKVLSSKATGGHPLFDDDTNTMFRAVHDVFGHIGTGRGVDRHGEEAAFLEHSRMFSPLARRALATETRGQNSAMIEAKGEFQPQKVGLLPEHMTRPQPFRVGPGEYKAAVRQARTFNL